MSEDSNVLGENNQTIVPVSQETLSIMRGHLKSTSRSSYKSYMTRLTKWVKDKFPNLYIEDSNEFNVPLPKEVVLAFIGDFVKTEDGKFKSASSISSFRSALAEHYKSRGVSFNEFAM